MRSKSGGAFMVSTWAAIDQIVVVLLGDDRTRLEKAKAVAELIRSAGAYQWVGLYEVGDQQINAIAWTGSLAPAFTTFSLSEGLSCAVRTRAPVIVGDVSADPRYVTTFPSTKSEIIVPALVGETVLGTIDVESEYLSTFESQDVRFLQDCARAARQLWSLHETENSKGGDGSSTGGSGGECKLKNEVRNAKKAIREVPKSGGPPKV
jgi:GAF domain-containing protein